MRYVGVVIVSILMVTSASATVSVSLSVEPSSQLPGIAPSLRVVAKNTSTESATVPMKVALQVVRADGTGFIPFGHPRADQRVIEFPAKDPIVLEPKETRDLSFWAGPDSPPWFAADTRLWTPGTYRIQLIADAALDSNQLSDDIRVIDQEGLLNPIVSNEVSFTVMQPTGKDAKVWDWIRQLPEPTFWHDALADAIWSEYRDSRYAAYVVPKPRPENSAQMIANLETAIQFKPDAITTDWYRFAIAHLQITVASEVFNGGDLEKAVQTSERARAILVDLQKNASDPYLRDQAGRLADRVNSREDFVRDQKAARGEYDKEIIGGVDCVQKLPDGKYRVWFGYMNRTPDTISVPVGERNKFTPPPFDRGQPGAFQAGVKHFGFSVITDVPELTWHIDKKNIHVIIRDTPVCPPHDPDRPWETPPAPVSP